MNRIITLLIFLALASTASAQMYYSAYEGNIDDCRLVGFGKTNETYDVAMRVDESALQGCRVTGMRFPVPDDAPNAKDYKVWLTHELTLTKGAVDPDMFVVDVTPKTGWAEITFPTPHTIDGPFYAGYSLSVSDLATEADYSPVVMLPFVGKGGSWLHTSRTYLRFVDYAAEAGMTTTIQLIIEGGSLPENAAAVWPFDDVFVQSGSVGVASLRVANHGAAPLASLDCTVEAAGKSVEQHITFAKPIESPFFGHETTIDVELPRIEELGTWPTKVTVTKVNDSDNDDEKASTEGALVVMSFVPHRRPLIEEYTGTWCGYCPRGYVGMEHMKALYGDEFVGVAYHNADAMEIMAQEKFPSVVANFPAAWMDRAFLTDAYYGNTNEISGIRRTWLERQRDIPVANIDVDATLSSGGSTLKVTATTTFVRDLTDANRYRVSYILTADGFSDFQKNYYTPGDSRIVGDDMDLFLNGGEMVKVTFNDVVAATTAASGIAGSIPAKVQQNVPVTHSHTFRLNEAKNTKGKQMFTEGIRPGAVVILVDTQTGEVVNAAKISYNRIIASEGIEPITLEQPDSTASPAYDLQGRRVSTPAKGVYIQNGRKTIR